jgi:hypothetical protein
MSFYSERAGHTDEGVKRMVRIERIMRIAPGAGRLLTPELDGVLLDCFGKLLFWPPEGVDCKTG